MSSPMSSPLSSSRTAGGLVPSGTTAPQYVGPTEAITAVANAITVDHKSLDILVTAAPLVTRAREAVATEPVKPGPGPSLYPVTISIAFISPLGGERQTQPYDAVAGNRFLHIDLEGDGQPRSVHLDITLTEPNPTGGQYSYNIPLEVPLDPLYDVSIYPLLFTLLNSGTLVGSTTIDLRWVGPSGGGSAQFDANQGEQTSVPEFKWSGSELSASANLLTPAMAYYIPASIGINFDPGWVPEDQVNLVPGKTRVINGNLDALLDESLGETLFGGPSSAYFQYAITYTLRGYFGAADRA